MKSNRRGFLKALGAAALALPFYELVKHGERKAHAGGVAKRVIFFYFPDGVGMPTATGDLDQSFHASGSETSFSLSKQLEPLDTAIPGKSYKNACVYLNGVSMWGSDTGNHPAGARKLLTGRNAGDGPSIDQYLAGTVGAASPWHHLYLGAMATKDGTDSSKCIVYPDGSGNPITPIDDPRVAFNSLFGGVPGGGGQAAGPDPVKVSVIDGVLDDMMRLQGQLGSTEKSKLDVHLQSLREVEKRIKDPGMTMPSASCQSPSVDPVSDGDLTNEARFPDVLRAQIDLMVLAMACGLTRVGTLQASHHTADLNMALFPGTQMASLNPNGMRSHEASHYGSTGDEKFTAYVAQVRWWVTQYTYLLDRLASTPEPAGGGSMLDSSLVLLCSEVSDGNTHSHDNMPFVLGGGGGGAVKTGRLLQYDNQPHSNLLLAIAHAMGQQIGSFGENSSGPLPGLLG
jgi:hypothetical protein